MLTDFDNILSNPGAYAALLVGIITALVAIYTTIVNRQVIPRNDAMGLLDTVHYLTQQVMSKDLELTLCNRRCIRANAETKRLSTRIHKVLELIIAGDYAGAKAMAER